MDRDDFLYPRSRYHNQSNPEQLTFNTHLQEFSQRIGFICNLQTNGKLSVEAAYQQVEQLWERLERVGEDLGIASSSAW